jgi:hypothetical protein
MNTQHDHLKKAIVAFVESKTSAYAFPLGGKTALFTQHEMAVLQFLQSGELGDEDLIRASSYDFNQSGCYEMATLGARLVLSAARKRDTVAFRFGLLVFFAAATTLDWRDTTTALSAVDVLARESGVDLQAESDRILGLIKNHELAEVVKAFFQRSAESRRPERMGLQRVGEGSTLTYVRLPW